MRRSHPQALRAAATGYAHQGIPILPDLPNHPPPDLAAGPPVCACRRRDCPAPPLHPPRPLVQQPNPWQSAQVARWWTLTPDAAIATVAGAAFDVIELHTAIRADVILEWLTGQGFTPGPVLSGGLGRMQLLAAPDSYEADRYDTAAAAVLYQPPGTLVLLPPSRLGDGQPVSWLRPLNPTTELPDGKELFFTLFDLPALRQLADPTCTPSPPAISSRHARPADPTTKHALEPPLGGAARPRLGGPRQSRRGSWPPLDGRPGEDHGRPFLSFLAVGAAVGRQAPGQRSRRWPGVHQPPPHPRRPAMTSSPSPDHIQEVLAALSAELAPMLDRLRTAMLAGQSPQSLGLVENGLATVLQQRGIGEALAETIQHPTARYTPAGSPKAPARDRCQPAARERRWSMRS